MYLFIGAIGAFIISLCMGMILIPVLHKLKFGQEIREEGPKWHAKKSGTPTMGGLIFIAAIFAMSAICCVLGLFFGIDMPADSTYLKTLVMLLCLSAVYGVIGFIDDYIKVKLKRNLVLTAKQKYLLQLVAAVGFVCWAV